MDLAEMGWAYRSGPAPPQPARRKSGPKQRGAEGHLPLSRLLHLHSDPLALRAPPFSLLVVDVALEFLHGDFAGLAGHGPLFVR